MLATEYQSRSQLSSPTQYYTKSSNVRSSTKKLRLWSSKTCLIGAMVPSTFSRHPSTVLSSLSMPELSQSGRCETLYSCRLLQKQSTNSTLTSPLSNSWSKWSRWTWTIYLLTQRSTPGDPSWRRGYRLCVANFFKTTASHTRTNWKWLTCWTELSFSTGIKSTSQN